VTLNLARKGNVLKTNEGVIKEKRSARHRMSSGEQPTQGYLCVRLVVGGEELEAWACDREIGGGFGDG